MKKILILLIIISSCKSGKQYSNSENLERNEFILNYKKSILYGCIEGGTNDNFHKFIKENNDLGISIIVETSKFDVIQVIELGKKISKNIRTINYSDYEGRKPIFSDCVSFAFSNESDSIAKERYNEFLTKNKP